MLLYFSVIFLSVEGIHFTSTQLLLSNVEMSTFKAYDVATFKSNVEEIVLNADADLGDVYLASWDRQYFLAHRIVLVCIRDLSEMTRMIDSFNMKCVITVSPHCSVLLVPS